MPDRTEAGRRLAAAGFRAAAADRHVAARLRELRIMLGLTQQELAGLIGVTHQQAHKYESGLNRIPAGRLPAIAGALGVGVGHFYEGLVGGDAPGTAAAPTPRQRDLLWLARDFAAMPDRRHQEALCQLARDLAEGNQGTDPSPASDEDHEMPEPRRGRRHSRTGDSGRPSVQAAHHEA